MSDAADRDPTAAPGFQELALSNLRIAIAQVKAAQKNILDRSDPRGRFLSIAITDMESAENWLVRQ